MAQPAPRIPEPDHPITIARTSGRVTVQVAGRTIADTSHALTLREASYPPVQYFPRADVDMTTLIRTDHRTHCPYKGDASYFSISSAGPRGANAVWSYEQPFEAVAAIKDYLAFYADRVEIAVTPAA